MMEKMKLSDPRVCAAAKVAGCFLLAIASVVLLVLLISTPYGGTAITAIIAAIVIKANEDRLPAERFHFAGCILAAAAAPACSAVFYRTCIGTEFEKDASSGGGVGHFNTAGTNMISILMGLLAAYAFIILFVIIRALYRSFLVDCAAPETPADVVDPAPATPEA